ncbi:MAG: amidohydrolase [Proteobacteria bacterium]|nr:amidohydrolase [Burkholderiales bacterium]
MNPAERFAVRAADCVLRGGRIVTRNPSAPYAEACALEGGRFVAVGSNEAVAARIGPATQVIELERRTVLPGLIDGHAHMDREGLKQVCPSLGDVRSIADVQQRIAALARTRPPGEWIVTMPIGTPPSYYDAPDCLRERRWPTRYELDAAAPDHPVFIRPIWGFWRHTEPLVSIANSRALALAGIDRHTVAPTPTVTIEHALDGEPTGVFLERTMMPIVEHSLLRCMPGFTDADRARTLPAAMQAYHAFGTTSIFEEHGAAAELVQAYRTVHRRGALTMRTALVASPDWRSAAASGGGTHPDDYRPRLEQWRAEMAQFDADAAWLRMTGVFVDIDVLADNRVRAWSMPYTGWAGFNYDTALAREKARALLVACAEQHVRAVAIWPNMLDLFEEVDRLVSIRDQRWVLGHVSTLSPRDVGRVRDLGLVTTSHTNRYIYKEGHLLQARLGPEREHEISPLRALVEAGVPLALATDNVPVSMFWPIWQATTRLNRYTDRPVAPAQALTRAQALDAATLGGAMLTFDEDVKGSIAPGKLADLTVLDADPLAVDDATLRDIRAELTMVGGRVVWRSDASVDPGGSVA